MRRSIISMCMGAVAMMALMTISIEPKFGFTEAFARASRSEVYRQLDLFGDVFERIRKEYVEEPDEAKMIQGAIKGMVALDPHSSYMDAKEFAEMQKQTSGNTQFGGLGIEVMMEDGVIKVVSPIDDTPASRAGIQTNDLIIQIDETEVQGLTLGQAVEKMRGPVNTSVKLKIVRKGQENPLDVTLTRDNIRTKAVRGRAEEDVAYIRIATFNQTTTDLLKQEIVKLSTQIGGKLKGFVIDLRNNPGGLLDESVTVSNAFLESGEIVSTRGRTAEESSRRGAKSSDFVTATRGKPVIVLINGGSASASEIVAGALQDHKRATLIGTRSFGKGSVQTIMPLGQGYGALRLTTARYFTPSGKSIQAKGIVPEIEVLQDEPEAIRGKINTRGEASLKGHLKVKDQEEQSGSQSYVPPDRANDKALDLSLRLMRGQETSAAFPPRQ